VIPGLFAFAAGLSAAPDAIGGDAVRQRGGVKEAMPGLGAEMRQIDCGHAVGGAQAQDLTGLHRHQPLARAQHGKGAEQPFAVDLDIPIRRHAREIAQALQQGHGNVTQGCGDGARGSGYQGKMFGFDIIDAGLLPAMLVALAAGVLSFLSPCVLPIVPPYLAYMGGISMSEMTGGAVAARRRVMLPALFFVLGLSTVFLLLGFTASAFGAFFLTNQEVFAQIAGAVVLVFGLHFLGVFRIGLLDREARLDAGDRGGSAFGAYVLGLAFAFGWTPCIGPQLGTILSLAAQEGSVQRGTLLLGVYAVGLGLPFLLAALFIERAMGLMQRLKPYMKWIERAMGALLVAVGLALLTGAFTDFSWWLLETFDRFGIPLLG
jgi:cytochrome c-type biogenesis protein